MLLQDCISKLTMNGQSVPVDTAVKPGVTRVTVTVTEGCFLYRDGRFEFHQRLRDGTYSIESSKPPGRLTWRRKAAFAKKQMRGGK